MVHRCFGGSHLLHAVMPVGRMDVMADCHLAHRRHLMPVLTASAGHGAIRGRCLDDERQGEQMWNE